MSSVLDVLIVGAGPAGLIAAYDLFWTDYNVKILEASGDIGGRVRKDTTFTDFPLDLGAEWIHTDPKILDTIVDDPAYPVQFDIYSDKNTFGEYDAKWDEWAYETAHVGDYKFRGATWYDFWKDYIAWDVEHLIEYNCVVKKIEWKTEPVTAYCADGHVQKAWHIIVTAPLSTLAKGAIDFVPNLPGKTQQAINIAGSPTNYYGGLKSWLKFSKKFWKNPTFGLATDYLPNERGERTFYDASSNQDSDEIVLGIVCLGETADKYKNWSEKDIVEDFIKDLVTMYGPVARNSYTGKSMVVNWADEPFAKGAYTMYLESGYGPLRRLRRPLGGNKLFFAGEGIPSGNLEHGFCHEAALSGRKAAQTIMNIYGDRRRHLTATELAHRDSMNMTATTHSSNVPSKPGSRK